MEIDAVERTIQISVGELARFQNGVHDYVSGGLEWRAAVSYTHLTLPTKA